MTKPVISLCDLTGNIALPWAEAGYTCYCYDIQHPAVMTRGPHPNIWLVNRDVCGLVLLKNAGHRVRISPCTHLAVSGARHFQAKGLGKLIEALTIVNACKEICEKIGAPWMLENPVSTISSYWRKPDHLFDPYEYGGYLGLPERIPCTECEWSTGELFCAVCKGTGEMPNPEADAYTKRTCLWTGGGFVMPARKPVVPVQGSKMHKMGPSPERANLRSETPRGFARAVFEANYQYCQADESVVDFDKYGEVA